MPVVARESEALAQEVCLVTGGARTLGEAIVRRLARSGAHVAIHYHRSAEAAQTLCAELTAAGVVTDVFSADVTQPDQVEGLVAAVVARFGEIDLLVNNVGPYVDTPFLDLAVDDFDRILAGNIRATFLLSQAVGRRMKARGSGHIVNIAATDFVHRSHSVYGLAKGGIVYLTGAMALELAPDVLVHALAPDLIADNEGMAEATVTPAIAGTPMRRLVTRAEVAEWVYLLCTPAFAMTTGQTILLDGGRSLPRITLGPLPE